MFELLTPTYAVLRTLTPRTEKHGDDDVSAVSLGLTITGANTLLDALQPGLRTTLYTVFEGQDQLPGVEPSTPLLRCRGIDSVKLDCCFEGWTLRVDRGIGDDTTVELGGCKVDAFAVWPHEGGSIDLQLRVGTSDISEDEAGWLFGKLKQELSITLHAPKPRAAAIDGSTQAFERDHPGASRSAEDLFAAGGDAGPRDDEPAGDDDGREGGNADAATAPRNGRRQAAKVH